MNKTELVAAMAEKTELSKESKEFLNQVKESMLKVLISLGH